MRITEIEYDISQRRYIFTIEQNGVTFFRFMDRVVIEDSMMFQSWVNSLLDQAAHGVK